MNLTFDFAFEGFRIIRERPKLIAFWGAITLFGYGVMSLIMVHLAGPELVGFNTMVVNSSTMAQPRFDQAYAAQMTQQILLAAALCLPVYLLMTSVVMCAICRVSLGETDDRLGFLAFGMPELRMLAVQAATLGMMIGLFFGICLIGGIIGLMIGGAGSQAATGVQTLSVIAGLGAVAWLGLRLSLNGPQSFEARRVDIFGSFTLTNGRFWSLFTGYATALALAQIVRFLCDKVIETIQVLSLGLKVTGDIAMPDVTNLTTFLTPASIIALVMTFIFVAPLMAAIQLGAPVAAYRVLRVNIKPRKVEEKAAG